MGGKRWRWIISVGVLAVVGAVGVTGWYVWLPGYRPALRPGEIYGIDVSDHQGPINWRTVARSDVAFAVIKATEGSTYVDPDFAPDLAQARSAGLLVGAYHFFTLCSPGASQAANFLKIAPPGSTALQPAVDLELAGNCSARPPASEVRSQLSDFVRRVEAATKQSVIFYIGASFDRRYPLQGIDTGLLWKRSILRRPSGAWAIWQVDGIARIDGITGRVDLDVMKRGDLLGRARNLPASLPRITPGGCCSRDRPETRVDVVSAHRTAVSRGIRSG